LENAGYVALDTVSAIVPYLPASSVAIKGGKAVSEGVGVVTDTTSAGKKAAKVKKISKTKKVKTTTKAKKAVKGKKVKGGSSSKTITIQYQMQKQVERGQAPKDIDRVDNPHVPGQQPHIHFKNGTSLNQDGTIHDKHRGTPRVSKKVREGIIKNGWETCD